MWMERACALVPNDMFSNRQDASSPSKTFSFLNISGVCPLDMKRRERGVGFISAVGWVLIYCGGGTQTL